MPVLLLVALCGGALHAERSESQGAAKFREIHATGKAIIREITGGISEERLQLLAKELRTDVTLLLEQVKTDQDAIDAETLKLYVGAMHGLHDCLFLRAYEQMAKQAKEVAHMVSKKFRGDLIGLVQVPDLSQGPSKNPLIGASQAANFKEVAEGMAKIVSTYELDVETHTIRNSKGKDEPRQFIAPRQSEKILARTRELLVKASARVDGVASGPEVAAVTPTSSGGVIESIVSSPTVQSDVKILYFTTERREGDGATSLAARINGELKNAGTGALGVQLQAVARDGAGRIVDSKEFWPASTSNIPAGASWPIAYTVSDKPDIAKVELRVINVKVW